MRPSCSRRAAAASATCSRTGSWTSTISSTRSAASRRAARRSTRRSSRSSSRGAGPEGPLDDLTPRELEVLGLMAEGRSNAGIAEQLVLTVGAVEKHVANIFTKLGLAAGRRRPPPRARRARVPAAGLSEQRSHDVVDSVEALLHALESRRSAGRVAERQVDVNVVTPSSFVQILRLDGVPIRTPFEQPRLASGSAARPPSRCHGTTSRFRLPSRRRSGSSRQRAGRSSTPSSPPRARANHLLTCSGFVKTSKTSAIGASNSRVMRTSRSFGSSMTVDPCPWVSLRLSLLL